MDAAKITIQTPALPGRITITSDPDTDNRWVVERKNFTPYEVEAVDVSSAVSQAMQNIHMFVRTAEFRAKRDANKIIRQKAAEAEAAKPARNRVRETAKPEAAVA